MYCSNCGQTQCYCYCRGCGVPWMDCQAQCGRPPMFNEVQQGYNTRETLMVAGNAFVSGVLGVFVGVIVFFGLFMVLTPDMADPNMLVFWLSIAAGVWVSFAARNWFFKH